MSGTFDFADRSRVFVEQAPDTGSPVNFNGWEFTAKPNVPYRRKFTVTLTGMKWYVANGVLDVTSNPKYNIGRLLDFYRANQMWDVFAVNHEYLGSILCRFAAPVNPPKALPDSNGKTEPFELSMIHYNPGY